MEVLLALTVFQLAAFCALAGFAWRRFDALDAEIARLRVALEARAMENAAPQRARKARQADLAVAAAAGLAPSVVAEPVEDVAAPASNNEARARPAGNSPPRVIPRLIPIDGAKPPPSSWGEPINFRITRDGRRGLAAAALIAAPAIALAFGASGIPLALAGIGLSVIMLFAAWRLGWRAAAWAAALGAGAWAFAALEENAAFSHPILFSCALAFAGAAGLVQAGLKRRAWSGAVMTLLMAGAALALAAETNFIGPAGIAYGVLVASAAALGASRLRRDALHVAAFAAAGAALMVLSGQPDAGTWFTPLAAWAGALFFGIAAVRVPALDSRGALLAATGVTAALFAAGSLAASQQGLAAPLAAAGAFAGLAVLFAGVLTLTARRAGGVNKLALTAWIMVLAMLGAAGAAILIALPSPLAAFAFALMAVALTGADRLWPDRVWRFFAICAALASFAAALAAIRLIGASDMLLGPYGQAAFGFALPAALTGAAAFAARRSPNTSGALEAIAIALALLFTTMLTRIVFSAGAPALQPVSLIEAGLHVAIWMGAALLLAARADRGAADVRRAYAILLSAASIGAVVIGMALLVFTHDWADRPETALNWAPLSHMPLGLVLPGLLAWAHYAFWRIERTPKRTRLALAVAGFMTASFVTYEVALSRTAAVVGGADWTVIGAGMLAFAIAAALQVAPGVTVATTNPRQLDLEEYLKRHGRRQART